MKTEQFPDSARLPNKEEFAHRGTSGCPMTKSTSTIAIVLCILTLLLAAAATPAEEVPAKLTVTDAVAIALRANARLKESNASYLDAASRLKIEKLRTTYYASSTLNFQRSENDSESSNLVTGNWRYQSPTGTEASVELSPYASGDSRGGLGLRLSRPLGSGSGRFSDKFDALQSAQASASLEYKSLYLAKQATVQDVITSYYDAVLAREKVAVIEGALQIAKQAAEDARSRLKEELVAEIDVSRADIRVAQTEDDLNQQRQQARRAVDTLMLSLGFGVGQNPELTDPVPEPRVPDLTLDEAIKKALENRAELAQYDIRLAEQERRVALRADRMRPKLDAVAGLDTRNSESGLLSSSITGSSTLTAGLEYRIPLDSRSLAADKETAARDLEVMKTRRGLEVERIVQEVRNAFRAIEESKATLEIFSENLKIAEKSLTLATRMFEEGLRDNRNVLDAQQDIARIKNDILVAKTDLYLAGLNLKYSMGEDLTTTENK